MHTHIHTDFTRFQEADEKEKKADANLELAEKLSSIAKAAKDAEFASEVCMRVCMYACIHVLSRPQNLQRGGGGGCEHNFICTSCFVHKYDMIMWYAL
jgi:hypothetical protein